MKARLLAAFTAALVASAQAAYAGTEHTVTLSAIDDYKAVFAKVESTDVIPARARISGTVDKLSVDEGSRVEQGQSIAVVRDRKLTLQLAALDARIKSLQAQRELAKIALGRATKLRTAGTGTQVRLDEAQTNLDVIDQNIAAMQAERAVASQQRTDGEILAPAAGRVLKVHVTEGTVMMPGEAVATIAAETYVLRMELPERHARYIGVGDSVLIGERGYDPVAFGNGPSVRKGTIRQVYPEIEGGRVIADVTVDGLGDFFVGERIRVMVSTGSRFAYVVPPEYVFYRYGLGYVTLKDMGAVVVQVGMPTAGGIEILSGVRDGDVLIEPESK